MRVYKKIKLLVSVITVLFLLLVPKLNAQPVTGLSGWDIYLDPGHSQKENMGIYGYSEAEKNLRVALNLRQMLLDWTDIDTVFMCREDDIESITLSQRTTDANNLGATWFHSIHSDASTMGSLANSTLLLWGQYLNWTEKIPNGGKAMSDIMIGLLTNGMRTYTVRGSIGDCTFYQPTTWCPYLSVNRYSNMPSELSEAGFHTNPIQNVLNMNAEWKKLEAYTFYWSILKYHSIERPYVGIVTGIISDLDSGVKLNGATVEVEGQTYTTDTWESLFYKYSSDPELLRNGFYFFENVSPGTHQLIAYAPGYDTLTVEVTPKDTFFTFVDLKLISKTPPKVLSTLPATGDSLYPGYDNLVINFSRPMDKATFESNISFNPPATATYTWSNSDFTVNINTSDFAFNSEYEVTISGNATDKYGHPFDGNGDGIGGDPLAFTIGTKPQDVTAPHVVDVYPQMDSTDIELKPVLNVAFDELINTQTLSGKLILVRNSTQTNATGIPKHYPVFGRSALNFFVTIPLIENEVYTIKVLPGLQDLYGNPITDQIEYSFTTGESNYNLRTSIDNFEVGIGNWYQPTSHPSTVGAIVDLTKISLSTSITNLSYRSMMLEYGWDTNASSWLIREYFTSTQPVFDANGLLQVYLFGDGSNNKFRFAVRETTIPSPSNYEVSPWYDVNWIGWRLVTWDLSLGETGSWIGNGVLEPPLRFDSFQMTYVPGNPSTGLHYFDDLRIASFDPVGVEMEDNGIPVSYNLEQNYPNPFNPATVIKFSIPEASNVKIIISDILGREVTTLVNDNLNAGSYSVNFDAGKISSGVYFYTLMTDKFKQSKKMLLMK